MPDPLRCETDRSRLVDVAFLDLSSSLIFDFFDDCLRMVLEATAVRKGKCEWK